MKTYLYISIFLIGFIFSCKPKIVEEDYDLTPSISFVKKDSSVCEGKTFLTNEPFIVTLFAEANAQFNKKISKIKVLKTFNLIPEIVLDTNVSIEKYTLTLNLNANSLNGLEYWRFIVWDEDNRSNEINFTITTINYPPTISLIEGDSCISNNQEMNINQPFFVHIIARGNANTSETINRFCISKTINSARNLLLDSTLNSLNFDCTKNFITSSTNTVEKWMFTVYDSKGESDSIGFTLYTIQKTYFEIEKQGVLWNMIGANANAWDLINDISVSPDNTEVADMANVLIDGSIGPYYFFSEWESLNQTLFKRHNSLDYDNAYLEETIDAYTGASISPAPIATGLSINDIYIAKIRNSDNYAVINVIDVVYTENDDLDKIEFKYKKIN